MVKKVHNNQPTKIGTYIRSRRAALQLTQADLADRMTKAGWPVTAASVSHWESTIRPVDPPLHNADFTRVLAGALDTTPVEIRVESGLFDGIDSDIADLIDRGDYANRAEIYGLVAILEKLPPDKRKIVRDIAASFSANG